MPEHGPDVASGRPAATFNAYILKAVAMIASERAGQGYDLHSYSPGTCPTVPTTQRRFDPTIHR
jgi:hypothetical protein